MKKSSVFSGALVLFLSNIIVKITGVIYKIPVQKIIGDTGMGYFNIAYNIYTWFYLICTAGLPVAVSICVAKAVACGDHGRCARIFRVSLFTFSSAGALFTFIMTAFSRRIASFSGIDNAYLCIIAIAPSVVLSCVSSAVRGYYQGHGIMWVTAVSQTLESVGKAVFGVLLALYSAERGNGLFVTASYAVFGISCGSFLSAVFCITVKLFYKKSSVTDKLIKEKVLPSVLKTALPVTLSSAVMNLSALTDVFIVPSRLIASGYTEAQAAAIFGNYTTLCLSYANLPMIFIYPLTSAILPVLSAHYAKKDMAAVNDLAKKAYRYALFVSLPCAVGMGVLSYQALSVVFPAQSASLAAPMLTALSPSVALCALLAVSDTVLQSCGKPSYPLYSMICGAAVKLLSVLILFRFDFIGRLAVPIGTCLCYLTAVIINTILSETKCGIKPYFDMMIKPAFCAALCGVSAYMINSVTAVYFTETLSTVLTILLTCSVYLFAIKLSKYIRISDYLYLKGNVYSRG